MGEHMLHPEGLAPLAQQVHDAHPEANEGGIASGVHGDGILHKMNTQYDRTQYNAIVVSPVSSTQVLATTQKPQESSHSSCSSCQVPSSKRTQFIAIPCLHAVLVATWVTC